MASGGIIALIVAGYAIWLLSNTAATPPAHFEGVTRPAGWNSFPPLLMINPPKVLEVAVTPVQGCLAAPCSVTFEAVVTNASGPLTYAWSGCASGDNAAATCTVANTEVVTAMVTVRDGSGAAAVSAARATARHVAVFYATDRAPEPPSQGVRFSGRRHTDTPDPMSYGVVTVAIPPGHLPGRVEWQTVRIEGDDAGEHFSIVDGSRRSEPAFFADLAARVGRSEGKEALVFVHGFRVDFDQAILRTAQLAWDLRFPGAPILYSWPTGGTVADYGTDYDSAIWARDHFQRFLRDVHQRSQARTIHLIAHSMGAWLVTNALSTMPPTPTGAPYLQELILAAPDVDRDVLRGGASAMRRAARRITLYAASQDTALEQSRRLRPGHARAGDSGGQLLVTDTIETVDASAVVDEGTDPLAHSYFAQSRSVLADVSEILRRSAPPAQRLGLDERRQGSLPYWVFLGAPLAMRILFSVLAAGILVGLLAFVAWNLSRAIRGEPKVP